MIFYTHVDSPIGSLLLRADQHSLTGLFFSTGDKARQQPGPEWQHEPARFAQIQAQLAEYFAGQRQRFDLPLAPSGTEFQRSVWSALQDIPFGETRSYGEIAQAIGRPKAVRAVGTANGSNPIALIIPCHRVIGADGSLTGFGGGLDVKRQLLTHELDSVGLFA